MKTLHKKKVKKIEDDEEEPTRDSRGFEALAEFISSEVVAQVKMGIGDITPLEAKEDDEPEEDAL